MANKVDFIIGYSVVSLYVVPSDKIGRIIDIVDNWDVYDNIFKIAEAIAKGTVQTVLCNGLVSEIDCNQIAIETNRMDFGYFLSKGLSDIINYCFRFSNGNMKPYNNIKLIPLLGIQNDNVDGKGVKKNTQSASPKSKYNTLAMLSRISVGEYFNTTEETSSHNIQDLHHDHIDYYKKYSTAKINNNYIDAEFVSVNIATNQLIIYNIRGSVPKSIDSLSLNGIEISLKHNIEMNFDSFSNSLVINL
ncbi:MAG: hypothetical protein ACRC6B_06545 [Fusobacteriaceae bacterium]